MTILIVCSDPERLNKLKEAIHVAGFRTISANGLDAAWTRTDYFDFGAVIIDHGLKDDIAASAFRQRFLTLTTPEADTPETVALELAGLFQRASELVH